MKDVMWGEGKSADGSGGLSFAQASASNDAFLFRPEWEAIKQSVLAELATSKRQVSYFCNDLVIRPENRLCWRAYRAALLELESEGAIVVLNKSGFGLADRDGVFRSRVSTSPGRTTRSSARRRLPNRAQFSRSAAPAATILIRCDCRRASVTPA